jgi:hypothetical protein
MPTRHVSTSGGRHDSGVLCLRARSVRLRGDEQRAMRRASVNEVRYVQARE